MQLHVFPRDRISAFAFRMGAYRISVLLLAVRQECVNTSCAQNGSGSTCAELGVLNRLYLTRRLVNLT